MEIIKFEIKNFRGVKSATLNLDRSPRSQVYTFVGLNESGKTTLLEAISRMGRSILDLRQIDPKKSQTSAKDYQSFIPVAKRYNFSGKIELIAHFRFSQDDIRRISTFVASTLKLELVHLSDVLTINRTMLYKDSQRQAHTNYWTLHPKLKKKRKGANVFTLSSDKNKEEWRSVASFIEQMIPDVLYFKSEVFDFPDRIYLSTNDTQKEEESDNEKEINSFYRDVVQDVLTAIDPSLSIETHIIDRKNRGGAHDMQNLSGLLQKMSQHVTHTVMRQWETIFQRKLQDKRISVNCEFDEGRNIYLQFKLEDGGEVFDISDRSTGFRWFFSFILLTGYRGYRKDSALILLDEPASNLHAAAQRQLLYCFKRIPDRFNVIYSTHSHYLVNPDWLDSTFIVKNEAATYSDADLDFDAAKTDIKLIPYKTFVSENPTQISYFQPVLDVLQYCPSNLELVRNCVLVEGKNDYYVLKYLMTVCLNLDTTFDLIPCMGAGTADQLIALYSGWGKDFLLLLDSDEEGHKQKARYTEKFGSLVQERVVSYHDVDPAWNGKAIEKMIGVPAAEAVIHKVFPGESYKKKKLGLAVQQLLACRVPTNLPASTKTTVRKIAAYVERRLSDQRAATHIDLETRQVTSATVAKH